MTGTVRFDHVSFRYPEASALALDDVDLLVPAGVFALAVGPTGSGKSTLLRAANGLVPHFTGGEFEGRVFVSARDTVDEAPRHFADVVGFVPQDPSASFVLDRVEDELAYGMENLAVPPDRMRRRVEEALDLLAVEPLRARSVRTLSGGERQRVAIAAALAAGPEVLVLDEPTSQLDPQGAEDVLAALQRLVHDHGVTVLLAEHRLERVAGFADLALGCEDGRVTAGSPADVIERLRSGPPVAHLARLVGWSPPPLTVREARAMAGGIRLAGLVDPPSPSPGDRTVDVRGLSAGYPGVPVLHRVDLTVGQGEIVAIMGRNGAGKTTLLRCLAGVHEPAGGEVRLGGHAPRPGIDVGLCPQDPDSILFTESVIAEVEATLRARAADIDDAPEILDRFGLASLGRRHPRDCSAGERLLAATAAIAATGAPVLLLDEPTRGLDASSKARLAQGLRGFAGEGGTVAFATHDVELAASGATRVVMFAGGEVIADGPPGNVLGDSAVFAPQMTRIFGPGWLTPEQVAAAAVPA